jgi:hypothetical protein
MWWLIGAVGVFVMIRLVWHIASVSDGPPRFYRWPL